MLSTLTYFKDHTTGRYGAGERQTVPPHLLQPEGALVVSDNWEVYKELGNTFRGKITTTAIRTGFEDYCDNWLRTPCTRSKCTSSTGFRTAMAAVHSCSSVSLYGVGITSCFVLVVMRLELIALHRLLNSFEMT